MSLSDALRNAIKAYQGTGAVLPPDLAIAAKRLNVIRWTCHREVNKITWYVFFHKANVVSTIYLINFHLFPPFYHAFQVFSE